MNKKKNENVNHSERNRDPISNVLIPEARGTTGFTMKGMLMLLILLGIIVCLKYLF